MDLPGKVKAWGLQGVKAVAAGADLVRRPPAGVTILLYHRVGRRTSVEVDLPTGVFDQQMAHLAAHHTLVSLDDAVSIVTGTLAPPGTNLVAVTFDDGTADLVDEALPVLARHRVPATFYLATAFIEEQRDFPDDGRPASWLGLRDALETGLVTIGSHTHTHRLLDRAEPSIVIEELDRSVDLIGERLGVRADHFAYPKAVAASPSAEPLVRARFRSAALGGNRSNAIGTADVHRLGRTAIQVADGHRWFEAKARGGLALEGTFRRLINRRRYADSVT